jgi:hypothetical protein
VDDEPVVDGGVGGDHERLGPDLAAGGGLHARIAAAFERLDMHSRVDLAPGGEHRLGQGGQVPQGMELALAGEPQGAAGVEGGQRGALHHLRLEAGPPRRVQLAVEDVGRVSGRDEEIAVHALEVAGDLLAGSDGLDAVDGGGVALRGQLRAPLPVQPLQDEEAIVEGAGEVGGGAARLAAADGAVVEHDHLAAFAREQVGGGQARDPRPHHADVGGQVLGQGRPAGDIGGAHPNGDGASAFGIHSSIVDAQGDEEREARVFPAAAASGSHPRTWTRGRHTQRASFANGVEGSARPREGRLARVTMAAPSQSIRSSR